jgi:hypothetical protein
MLAGAKLSEKLFRQNLFYKKKSFAVRAVELALIAPFYLLADLLLTGSGQVVASLLPDIVVRHGHDIAAVAGLLMFVAVALSSHPEAYKVRRFFAAILGFTVVLLGTAGILAFRLSLR